MAKKGHKAEKGFECLSVTSVIVYPFHDGANPGKILGLANVVLNDQLTIRGLRIMDGENGRFVAYPTDPFYKGEDFRAIAFPITRELREHIENCVLEKYLYETGNAHVNFDVELTHRELLGGVLKMEIIATSEKDAVEKAKARAIELIPATKDSKDEWVLVKVPKHE